jgi:TonB family protein
MRRLKRSSEAQVPPKALHQVIPAVSAADRRLLKLPLTVDIRVGVDEQGRVQSVEPLSGTDRQTSFAKAAISASRGWKFAPAQVGDETVPGSVILHFKFQPPNP